MNNQLNLESLPQTAVLQAALTQLEENQIMTRIWDHDHTVWRDDPTEISNRLAWLHMPEKMMAEIGRLQTFAAAARADGFDNVLLLGMGGSSLAPELFDLVFADESDGLPLEIVDTTDAEAVLAKANGRDLSKTLFIVATKSGGTAETLSAFKYFYNLTAALVGMEQAGQQFVAITDPGSKLVTLAEKYGFRETFLNDPDVGGRYSVLTLFGLVPAALVGVDLTRLLERAQTAVADQAAAAQLGVVMAEMARLGRDKLTLVVSKPIVSFADWAEQLIAESTGKEGKGILPVVGEPVGSADVYGEDRLFVHLRLAEDDTYDAALFDLTAAGQPVIRFDLASKYDLGYHFFLWELATAVAGHCLGIQPFDQPNVESAKVQARKVMATYSETGELPQMETADLSAAVLHEFLAQAQPGDYISVHAYVPYGVEIETALRTLQAQLRDRYQLATTVGYGPRFLHSTGQFHKGDSGNGLFIQIISDPARDIAIPDEAGGFASAMDFGVLQQAQALGDAAALQEADRRLLRFHVGPDVVTALTQLLD